MTCEKAALTTVCIVTIGVAGYALWPIVVGAVKWVFG